MSKLYEHVQETIGLLVAHARDGYAENVRQRPSNDDHMLAKIAYPAMLELALQLEEHGYGYVLLPKGLPDKHYKNLAKNVRPHGLSVSRYVSAEGERLPGGVRRLHYLHSGTLDELDRRVQEGSRDHRLMHDRTL